MRIAGDEVVRACDAIGRDTQSIELGVFTAPPDEGKLTELATLGMSPAARVLDGGIVSDRHVIAHRQVAVFGVLTSAPASAARETSRSRSASWRSRLPSTPTRKVVTPDRS